MSGKRILRRVFLLFLSLMLLLTCLFGCGKADKPQDETESIPSSTDDGSIELWVLTDITMRDGMNGQARNAVKTFQSENGNVTINLEILPADAKEREARLEQLRVEILAGKGPDVYLMPTNNYLKLDISVEGQSYLLEPLFSDVEMTMYNGHFADISAYYDADEDLNKEGLITKVMDAGVLGDARYILPLRYNIPVLYADTARLEEFEVDKERLYSGNIMDLMDLAIETEDQLLAGGAVSVLVQRGLLLSLFPDVLDYEKGKVNLTQEELASFLTKLQQIRVVTKGNMEYYNYVNVNRYVRYRESLSARRYPIKQGLLDEAIAVISVSKAVGDDITMIPLRATGGSLVAHVTYYGAVGSSCEYPELAYEFLRMFLQEDMQWEYVRTTTNQTQTFVDDGWPVRAVGATEHLEETCYRGLLRDFVQMEDMKERLTEVIEVEIMDEDVIDLLTVQIDEVRFRIPLEWDFRDYTSSISVEGYYPSDVDINEVAEEMLYMLKLHLAEG